MSGPEELSPVPVLPTAEVGRLPFGLTWCDVADALPGFDGEATAQVSHLSRGRHRGGRPSVIMTLRYSDDHGRPHERTVFFKHNNDGSRESGAYRHLAAQGVATPRLLVCADRPDGEVLGLEFLPSIGIGAGDLDDLLHLLATLNTVTDTPAEIAALPGGMPQPAFERQLAAALATIAEDGPGLDPAAWLDRYRSALPDYRRLPHALTHGELAPQQLGRTSEGRLVVFDLATLGLRPRFADLANLLPGLTRLTDRDERSILARYLTYLGGPPDHGDLERSWRELRLTRFVQAVEALPWQLTLDDPAGLREQLRVIADDGRSHPSVR